MLLNSKAEFFIPENLDFEKSLSRTTHMGIVAHSDDLEILAYHGILRCFASKERWFFGVVVTDGAGSPTSGIYENFTENDLINKRREEQKKAAVTGEYSGVAFLNYKSANIINPEEKGVMEDMASIICSSGPTIIYTHNPADKHDTHVAVALRVIQSIRELPAEYKPEALYGCEVWRSLDWLIDDDKKVFDVSERESLAQSLLKTFDSQITGGKRYDLATIGRRKANATYADPHCTDKMQSVIYGIDLTPLISDINISVTEYISDYINRFKEDVTQKIVALS